MNMEIITSTASEMLVNIALAVITLAGAYALYYIRIGAAKVKAQTSQIQDETTRKLLDNALDDVINLTTLSVNAMEQTTARALRDAIKTGAADPEKLKKLAGQVLAEVKSAIAPEAQAVITRNLGSFDAYVAKCIEDAVLRVKREAPVLGLPSEILTTGVDFGTEKGTTVTSEQ